jgi:hypothetical protein
MADIGIIITIVVSIVGFFFSIVQIVRGRAEWARAYFQIDIDKEYVDMRKRVHALRKGFVFADLPQDDQNAVVMVIIVYDWYALFVRKKQCPSWIYRETSALHTCIKFYETLEDYIRQRRENNPKYANHFEWLYRKCKEWEKRFDHSDAAWGRSVARSRTGPCI